ncbi:MAG: type VI secretion system lipoprotein TssJ [Bacteroidota bacterium]
MPAIPLFRRSPGTVAVRAIALLAAVLFLALTAGCGRTAPVALPELPTEPEVLSVTLRGTAALNSGGNAAVVRVYPLSNDATFTATPLQQFWEDDVGAVGAALVGRAQEVQLYPGESQTVQFTLTPEVRFIGVAADLRTPDDQHWRGIAPLDAFRPAGSVVVVDSTRLFLPN